MSSLYRIAPSYARRFNLENARRLGWDGKIPAEALRDHPDLQWGTEAALADAAKGDKFVRAVEGFQTGWNAHPARGTSPVLEIDGMLGRSTWVAMQRRYAPVADSAAHVVHRGLRVPLGPVLEGIDCKTWEQEPAFDMHHGGDFRKDPKRQIKAIVLHWGGLDLVHCRRALLGENCSSHFGVEGNRVRQWLDLDLVAYHAGGGANTHTIGIDICQYPRPSVGGAGVLLLRRYQSEGKTIEVRHGSCHIDGQSVRAFSPRLTLDTETARTTARLVYALCRAFDVPMVCPRHKHGHQDHNRLVYPPDHILNVGGVLGHHHIADRKYDVAQWWGQIMAHLTDLPGAAGLVCESHSG